MLDLNLIYDACFFAILSACFFGLLRISNVVSFCVLGDRKLFSFNGERVHYAVLPSYPGHPLCPVSALRHFLTLSGEDFESSTCLFRFRKQRSVVVPSANWVRSKLSKLLNQLGFASSFFSSHSLRRGGASWLLNAGVPLHIIRILGDWKSDAVFQYLCPSPEAIFSHFLQIVILFFHQSQTFFSGFGLSLSAFSCYFGYAMFQF